MQETEGLSGAARELEAALAGLQPAAATIDRDRLMFQAGRASTRRRRRLWQAAAGVLAAALVVSAGIRPEPTETVRVVRVAGPAIEAGDAVGTPATPIPASPATPAWAYPARAAWPGGQAYLAARDAVLATGVDALPANPDYQRGRSANGGLADLLGGTRITGWPRRQQH